MRCACASRRIWSNCHSLVAHSVCQDTSILLADELNDKLKLLDYEEKFCSPKDVVAFPRTYFSIPASNTR